MRALWIKHHLKQHGSHKAGRNKEVYARDTTVGASSSDRGSEQSDKICKQGTKMRNAITLACVGYTSVSMRNHISPKVEDPFSVLT